MKKKIPKLFFNVLLATTTLLFACKDKVTENSKLIKSKSELLCAAPWKLTKYYHVNNKGIVEDYYIDSELCEVDNLIGYSQDGSLIIDEGETKCSPTDQQMTSHTWKFTLDESKIIHSWDPLDAWQIEELNEHAFTYSLMFDYGLPSGVKKIVFSYSH